MQPEDILKIVESAFDGSIYPLNEDLVGGKEEFLAEVKEEITKLFNENDLSKD